MSSSLDIWKMLAGVAIFLLGTNFMEESLRILAGRRFKLFLKKQTSHKLKAIGSGAVVTGLLQSSSIVNLLVLSLVGAGVIKMKNALAVMLGSNLGSTFSNWIIATIGFTYSIDSFALPLAGITGIGLAFFKTAGRWYQWSRFLLGFSFLFIGLGFIKEGMQELVLQTDLTRFNQYPVIVFLGIGFILTTIVQSSSATIALTLSALYSDAISLHAAMAIALGSEIGTTIKLFLASAKGLVVKKRVALGNFLFNTITVVVMLILLQPVNRLITEQLQINDNLLALVFFQSFVNLASIILFFPFLNVFGGFLERRFSHDDEERLFIRKVNPHDAKLALEAMDKDARIFIFHTLDFCMHAIDTENKIPGEMLHSHFSRKTVMEKYEYIKHLHGEIHNFYSRLQNISLSKEEAERREQLISAVRNGMYAAKNLRDALHDIGQLRKSSNDIKYNFYLHAQKEMNLFSEKVMGLMQLREGSKSSFDELSALYQVTRRGYTENLGLLYKEGMAKHLNEAEISTLINFNREMYTAYKSVVFAVKDYLLETKESDAFDDLPGFIR